MPAVQTVKFIALKCLLESPQIKNLQPYVKNQEKSKSNKRKDIIRNQCCFYFKENTENYKTLLEEINEDINKQKDNPCSWIEILHIIKMSILLKAIYRFNTIPINISVAFFFCIYRKNNPQIYMESQRILISHNNFRREE